MARGRAEGRLAGRRRDRRVERRRGRQIASSRWAAARNRTRNVVWCLDADSGRVLWQFTLSRRKFDARQFEGGPASTPTIDGRFVYTLGYLGHVHCLNLEDGRVVWRKHLVDDFGGRYSSWKYAGSPLVTGELVIFDTGADGNSTVALDKTTGRKVWGAGNDLAGYSTPIPFEHSGRRGVLVFKARAMVAHDLATGRELWRIDWRTNYDCNASTPTVVGDKLFISTGYGGQRARGALFQLGEGEPRQIWLNQDLETKMNSAVVYEGHVYCVSERARRAIDVLRSARRRRRLVRTELRQIRHADDRRREADRPRREGRSGDRRRHARRVPRTGPRQESSTVGAGSCRSWRTGASTQRTTRARSSAWTFAQNGPNKSGAGASLHLADDAKAEVEIPADGDDLGAVRGAADGGEVDPATAARNAAISAWPGPSGR